MPFGFAVAVAAVAAVLRFLRCRPMGSSKREARFGGMTTSSNLRAGWGFGGREEVVAVVRGGGGGGRFGGDAVARRGT
ncbi:hypothetical protein HOY82DRAFT_564775 [Tuber indicum]|nr:hypothetical protein HOY82DRAFT_564775 [Tuber indicum]